MRIHFMMSFLLSPNFNIYSLILMGLAIIRGSESALTSIDIFNC